MSDTKTWFDVSLSRFEAVVDTADDTQDFWLSPDIAWDSLRPSNIPQSLDEWYAEAMRSLDELQTNGHLAVFNHHEEALRTLDAIQSDSPLSVS